MAFKARAKPYVGVAIKHTGDPAQPFEYTRHACINDEFVVHMDMPKDGGSVNVEFFFIKLPKPMDRYEGHQYLLDNVNHYERVFNDPELQAWFQSEIDKANGVKQEKEALIIVEKTYKEHSDGEAKAIKDQQLQRILNKSALTDNMDINDEDDIPEFLQRVG